MRIHDCIREVTHLLGAHCRYHLMPSLIRALIVTSLLAPAAYAQPCTELPVLFIVQGKYA